MCLSLDILKKGENDIARECAKTLTVSLKYSSEQWIICDKKSNLWRFIKDPTATIITHIQDEIDLRRKELLEEKIKCDDQKLKEEFDKKDKTYFAFYKSVGGSGTSNQIKKCLQEYLYCPNFCECLDNNMYKIAYKNGILDLKNMEFRYNIEPKDYLTKTIPYDYVKASDDDLALVRKELKKICNWNEQHLNYYLSALGAALTGDSSKLQEFYTIIGQKASNGKSVVFEALVRIIPNYVIQLESDVFEVNNTQRHKAIAKWRGGRIAFLNELTRRKQDAEVIKKVCDGTSISYKVMYGTNEDMPITFKLFIVGNHTININADNGVKRRLKAMQMDSDFEEGRAEDDFENRKFIKDKSFGELLVTKYKDALLQLILQYSNKFANEGQLQPYPKDWKEESDEVCEQNSKFDAWFYDHFELDSNKDTGFVSKVVMEELLKSYGEKCNPKDEFKRMKINWSYDRDKQINKKKGVYYGFKTIKIEESCLLQVKVEPKVVVGELKISEECKCGLKFINICKCTNPSFEKHRLSNNLICIVCRKWKDRCNPSDSN